MSVWRMMKLLTSWLVNIYLTSNESVLFLSVMDIDKQNSHLIHTHHWHNYNIENILVVRHGRKHCWNSQNNGLKDWTHKTSACAGGQGMWAKPQEERVSHSYLRKLRTTNCFRVSWWKRDSLLLRPCICVSVLKNNLTHLVTFKGCMFSNRVILLMGMWGWTWATQTRTWGDSHSNFETR